jgi:hypothetical protein
MYQYKTKPHFREIFLFIFLKPASMKSIKKTVLTVLIFATACLSSKATIMGSDMSWSCLGGDSFLIRVTVYNDCNGTAMGNITIDFKCATSGTSITSLTLAVPNPVDITPVCPSVCTRCDSATCTFPYGVNRYLYQGIVKLSTAGSCCNILMSYSYGNRNTSITTGAGGQPFYTEAIMNRCQNPCDYSPVFTNPPIAILCVGQDFTFNHGMIDSNSIKSGTTIDSFTYEWGTPLKSAGQVISYTGQYAYNKAVYFWGFPNENLPFPRGLHLDPETGDIQFRPMKAEVTVMVLKVNEFRNGVKIAEIRRDLQVIVITCTSNNPPMITTPNNVRSKSVCAGSPATFTFSTNDPNSNDTVTISWDNALPGATWTTNNGQVKHPTATLTWTPTDSQVSSLPFTFTVTAKDNACPIRAQYTQAYQITVKPNPKANIIVTDSLCGDYWFMAQRILGSGPSYMWQGQSFNFSPVNGVLVNNHFAPGKYLYSMTMTASGCSNTYYDSIVVDTQMTNTMVQYPLVCYGTTLTLTSNVEHPTGPVKMIWGSGNTSFPGDTFFSKTITVTSDTVIWSIATDSLGCSVSDTVRICIPKPIGLELGPDVNVCLHDMATLQAAYNISNNAIGQIIWKNMAANTVVSTTDMLSTHDTGFFSCMMKDTFGCTAYDSIHVAKNPQLTAHTTGKTICMGDVAELTADSTGGSATEYEWYDGKMLIETNRICRIKPITSKSYMLKVKETINGTTCADSTYTYVIVLPNPSVTFENFGKNCEYGKQIILDSFVHVDGINVNGGIWSCPDEPSQLASNIFFAQSAYANTNPGYKLLYSYTDPATGCTGTDSVYLPLYPRPARPQIMVIGDTIFCSGNSVILLATAPNQEYGWTNGDTARQISISASGNYRLAVTDNNGCVSDSSAGVNVLVYPNPPRPEISLSPADSFLECDLVNGIYYWFYRPDTMSTAIFIGSGQRKINPRYYCNNCYFYVVFADSNGCISDSSAGYYFNYNSVNEPLSSSIKFYPNPAHQLLFVEYSGSLPSKLTLTDLPGKTILETKIIPGKNRLNIQNYKPGIYFLFMDGRIAGKIILK